MNKKLKAKWIRALKSGEYQQGRAFLRKVKRGGESARHCCLGVLCEIGGGKWTRKGNVWGYVLPNGSFATNNEPAHIAEAFGLNNPAWDYASKNDRGVPFKDIVNTIKQEE